MFPLKHQMPNTTYATLSVMSELTKRQHIVGIQWLYANMLAKVQLILQIGFDLRRNLMMHGMKSKL